MLYDSLGPWAFTSLFLCSNLLIAAGLDIHATMHAIISPGVYEVPPLTGVLIDGFGTTELYADTVAGLDLPLANHCQTTLSQLSLAATGKSLPFSRSHLREEYGLWLEQFKRLCYIIRDISEGRSE
jgi:hypothetical protein